MKRGADSRVEYHGLPSDSDFPDDAYWPEEDGAGHRDLRSSHGLVSSVYYGMASGDYLHPEERLRRARKALKRLIVTVGPDATARRLEQASVSVTDEPVRRYLQDELERLRAQKTPRAS